jgi:predicted nucleotidyltransferase
MQVIHIDGIGTIPFQDRYVLKTMSMYIEGFVTVSFIALFGSRARGTHRKDSDTDILVITEIQLKPDMHVFERCSQLNKMYKADLSLSLIGAKQWEKPRYKSQRELKENIERDFIILTW